MKANQAFRKEADDAVSPVIAVILMVAITVVLAATVYVWVSGFSSNSSSATKTMSLASAGALSNMWKNYTIASATNGMKYSDTTITVNGATYTYDTAASCSVPTLAASKYAVCHGGSALPTSANVVTAGDTLMLSGISSGQTLRVLDSQANSVIASLTIG
jgi:flagellin-like protein